MNGSLRGDPASLQDADPRKNVIRSDTDIVAARHLGRQMAEQVGFGRSDQALIATAISELARNVLRYAGSGTIEMQIVTKSRTRGIVVAVRDNGPGIADVELAMRDGFSTGGSLGLGLPGTKRIMDGFTLETAPGDGVRVTISKWVTT